LTFIILTDLIFRVAILRMQIQTIKPPPFVGPQSMGGSFGFKIFQRKPAA